MGSLSKNKDIWNEVIILNIPFFYSCSVFYKKKKQKQKQKQQTNKQKKTTKKENLKTERMNL